MYSRDDYFKLEERPIVENVQKIWVKVMSQEGD
jgi:hypothetical protein